MIKLQIDNKNIGVKEGVRLIEVARQHGISIPSLCYRDDLPHYTSCSVCLVKNKNTNKFLHSCSVLAEDGMKIDASSEEVLELRKSAVSMLLSEHRAECQAPCEVVCPLGLNIPLMNRYIQQEDNKAASDLAFAEMGIPETLCSLCPEYCENACRRKMIDHSIAIVNIKRFSFENASVNQIDFESPITENAKKIALIGGGMDGLTAAFFLSQKGHKIVIFEKEQQVGGAIVNKLDKENKKIFEQELQNILASGVEIKYNNFIDENQINNSLIEAFDTVLIACSGFENMKSDTADSYLLFEGDMLSLKGKSIFKIGKAAKENKQIIRDIGQAKKAALSIDFFLKSGKSKSLKKAFNSSIGKIEEHEKKAWLQETPENTSRYQSPLSIEESRKEAENCMHCDCRAQSDCQLRIISADYQLNNPKLKMYSHPIEKKINFESGLIFENAKCIKCGLCVRLLQKEMGSSELGFQGRGFMSIISESLTQNFNDILKGKTKMLVDICPTAALSKREDYLK